jgi:hypothetical protein
VSNAYNPPPPPLPKRKGKDHHLGLLVDEAFLARLREHRDLLDAARGTEADVTSMSATVRHLCTWAMDRIERGER